MYAILRKSEENHSKGTIVVAGWHQRVLRYYQETQKLHGISFIILSDYLSLISYKCFAFLTFRPGIASLRTEILSAISLESSICAGGALSSIAIYRVSQTFTLSRHLLAYTYIYLTVANASLGVRSE